MDDEEKWRIINAIAPEHRIVQEALQGRKGHPLRDLGFLTVREALARLAGVQEEPLRPPRDP